MQKVVNFPISLQDSIALSKPMILRLGPNPRKDGGVLTFRLCRGKDIEVKLRRRGVLILILVYRSKLEPCPDRDNPGFLGTTRLWQQYMNVSGLEPTYDSVRKYVSAFNGGVHAQLIAALRLDADTELVDIVQPGYCLASDSLELSETLRSIDLKNDRELAWVLGYQDWSGALTCARD